jgi:hypothetical protein
MIARLARPRYMVLLEIPRVGGWREWGAEAGAFEQRLAARAGVDVAAAVLESEIRRGRDSVRIRIAVTVSASDPGQAAVTAWRVFLEAVGESAAAWDIAAASAEIQPAGKALARRVQ